MRVINLYVLLLLPLFSCLPCFAVQTAAGTGPEASGDTLPREAYRIVCDRALYIAGETVFFRVFPGLSTNEESWSRVYYLELIRPDGNSAAGAKFILGPSGTAGALEIPPDIPSGTYYLRGYTRWMRNRGPAAFDYTRIRVLNPYVRRILPADADTVDAVVVHELAPHSPDRSGLSLRVEGGKRRRAEGRVVLSLPEDAQGSVDCAVSLVPTGAGSPEVVGIDAGRGDQTEGDSGRSFRDLFLPETRGVSVSGAVTSATSGKGVPYALVYLSVPGDRQHFYCNFSDSLGRFAFAFPPTFGPRDLFLSATPPDTSAISLHIEQDFSKAAIRLPAPALDITEEEALLIGRMATQMRVMMQYGRPDEARALLPEQEEEAPFFYGTPTSIVHFADFISLPSMEEYFTEVTPQVALRRTSAGWAFRVVGAHPDLRVFPPLLMVDGVAIPDADAVLAMSPRRINRVEIVEAPYIRGNVSFGGIINIISKQGDMGLIHLPESGLMVHYHMYAPDWRSIVPGGAAEPNIPDLRNTLYWNPAVVLEPGQDTVLHFTSPDTEGDYEWHVTGFEAGGGYFESYYPFRVDRPSREGSGFSR